MTQNYFGLNRGQSIGPDTVTVTSGSTGSTDVEFRVDSTKSLTRQDIVMALDTLRVYFLDGRLDTYLA
jgi:hypothetical protein